MFFHDIDLLTNGFFQRKKWLGMSVEHILFESDRQTLVQKLKAFFLE